MSTPNPYLRFASPHIVQCFEQDATFIERLQEYLDAGMSRGDSVLLFATPAHVDALALLGVGSPPRDVAFWMRRKCCSNSSMHRNWLESNSGWWWTHCAKT